MPLRFARATRETTVHPQTLVVLGDSLTEQGGFLTNGTSPWYMPKSYWTHANVLLGWRFRVLRNSGIFGQTTTQILQRLEQDAISYRPGWVWLLAGTNDVGRGILQTTTIPNLRRILDRLEQANIRVAWLTIPPRAGSYTGTQLADTIALNDWIRQEARGRANVILVDAWRALAGQSQNYLSTLYGHNPTSDGLHLSSTGAFAVGQLLAAALAPLTSPRDPFPYTIQPYGLNMLPDPRFNSGTGTSAPTAWTMVSSSGVTYSKTLRSDEPGYWQTFVVPSGTVNFAVQGNAAADRSGRSGASMIGRQVVGTIEFQVSGLEQSANDGSQGFFISVGFYNGSSFTQNYAMQDYSGPNVNRSGRIVTTPITVPTGTTTISLFVYMVGGGTYSLDKAGIFDVDQSGILTP